MQNETLKAQSEKESEKEKKGKGKAVKQSINEGETTKQNSGKQNQASNVFS
jgi:hypothetical protein